METAVCVSGLLLLVFITRAQLSPDPKPVFGAVAGNARFDTLSYHLDYYVLFRVTTDGDLLLANCSGGPQPDRPKPDGCEVECNYTVGYSFVMANLTMSQSGDYRADGWRGGNIIEFINFHLFICVEGSEEEEESVYDDNSAGVCGMDSALGNGNSLQVYRFNTLVLDTSSSLEPLVEDLRGRLQVDLSTSQVTLSGVTEVYDKFYCTVWRGAQCQSHRSKVLSVGDKAVFAHAGDNITLRCLLHSRLRKGKVGWDTPTGRHKFNMINQQEVMYRSKTGNYSLFIPSVSQHHSGEYECQRMWKYGRSPVLTLNLYVCPIVSPLDVIFSHGESVHLNYSPQLRFSSVDGIMWYRQRVLQPLELILDSRRGSVSLPEDLRGRVSLRGQVTWRGRSTKQGKLTEGQRLTNSPLILSKLTAEDSGLYTWRVFETMFSKCICSEGSFRLVYRDPFGVHSPFYRAYAPLIGCGLLGLVAALIWFKLRSRIGEQTSGRQSREGQQSGDDDIQEEVEMAELSA